MIRLLYCLAVVCALTIPGALHAAHTATHLDGHGRLKQQVPNGNPQQAGPAVAGHSIHATGNGKHISTVHAMNGNKQVLLTKVVHSGKPHHRQNALLPTEELSPFVTAVTPEANAQIAFIGFVFNFGGAWYIVWFPAQVVDPNVVNASAPYDPTANAP
jgi:hypothetical protein